MQLVLHSGKLLLANVKFSLLELQSLFQVLILSLKASTITVGLWCKLVIKVSMDPLRFSLSSQLGVNKRNTLSKLVVSRLQLAI
jgi:hypothetical protein